MSEEQNQKPSPWDSESEHAESTPSMPQDRDESEIPSSLFEDGVEYDEDGEAIVDTPSVKKRKPLKIPVFSTVIACISLVLAAVMLTYTICSSMYRQKLAAMQGKVVLNENTSTPIDKMEDSLALFAALFDKYSVSAGEVDDRAIIDAALKEYVRQTGDRYAAYYTAEEFAILSKNEEGKSQGIGVSVIASSLDMDDESFTVMKIVNVMKDSPAMEAGVKPNDLIVYVGLGENQQAVNALGFDPALDALQGTVGTLAEFIVWRDNGNGKYKEIPFSIERKEFTEWSVLSHACTVEGYEDVGIVKIIQFDWNTPAQLCDAMDSLLAEGCKRFVFDVRHNPGGDLASIKAVLSYFLTEGDTIIRTKDKSGTETTTVVELIQKYATNSYKASCNVSSEDIGKYRGYEMAVLCNGETASAAELFTAALRDYELATIVGTTTYGKGSMQTIRSLLPYGFDGALKMTTAFYYPPLGEGYDGIGIEPHVTVELSEEAAKINIYEIRDAEDNQLMEAIRQISDS